MRRATSLGSKTEMARAEMRPQWRHFWSVTRDAYRTGDDPCPTIRCPTLRAKTALRQGSIFDLPERAFGRRHHVLLRGIDHRAAG